jgi:predicted nucleic acid-binding protein
LISFDSNILVYAADPAAGERRVRSADLLARAMRRQVCTQALQSLCEFFSVITRKSGVDAAEAAELVAAWAAAMTVEQAQQEDLEAAMRAVRDHRLSFWDAMLWATVRRAGVRVLLSEDFQDGRTLEGVRFVDPFAAHNHALIDREIPR